jgi:hypothetical protein
MHDSSSPPPLALGATSLVLSMIATMLVFLPVLSIPIAGCAAITAVGGIATAGWRAREQFNWSLMGLALSLLILGVGVAINFAPRDEQPRPLVPELWQEPAAAPFIAPPAASR